ncbi:aminopeptidase P family N-terminal domain-containing protein [Bradyrhizobium sp. 521_C7_N1_3]|uniref:aminopeptidase P family N-terminal domain-containing protein n=1 Tax=Bradyrhizobium sp. 521_C7_N1_3 TaxID=3240368 RepID=UPI003F8A3D94
MTVSKGLQAFPRTEYLRRLAALKPEMRRREIDVFFVTSPCNITYLTGHTAASAYVPQGLVFRSMKRSQSSSSVGWMHRQQFGRRFRTRITSSGIPRISWASGYRWLRQSDRISL